jgi:transmembrane sensor
MKSHPTSESTDPIARAAAEWVLRHDRGLTAAEQDEFLQWLATDPRHRAAWAEHRWGWDELDRLAGLQASVHAVPDPDLLAPKRARHHRRRLMTVLAAAALVAGGLFLRQKTEPAAAPRESAPARSLALIEQRELPDGSVIELNRGAVVTEHYTAGERRVQLERGEAHFKVAKDASRPFFVEAGGVAVRAVGTAFNVRLDPASVEVLVTEGKVGVSNQRTEDRGREAEASGPEDQPIHLIAGERTVVSFAPAAPAPQVTVVPPAEIEARLAWQPRLLDFTDTSLADIVAEFNRHNPVRLILGDPGLREVRLSATFRSDNVEGFVRLMGSDFGMKAAWRGDAEIVLSRAR